MTRETPVRGDSRPGDDGPRRGWTASLGESGKWSLGEVVDWLVAEGFGCTDPAQFTQALCERLVRAGLPLSRLRLNFRTLHPELAAYGCLWTRGGRAQAHTVRHSARETDAYVGSPIEAVNSSGRMFRRRLTTLDPTTEHRVLFELAGAGHTDYAAMPVHFGGGAGGAVLVFVTDAAAGFDDADLRKLVALLALLTPVLEVFSIRDTARSLLDTYLGPRTGDRVLRGLIRRGDSEAIHAALWFSDLRDFTSLTESLPLDDLLATLNDYFELVAAAVTARGGEILRFIGDAMLIVFPQPAGAGGGDPCAAALDAAQDAFDSLAVLNHRRRRRHLPPIEFGVGLHVGEVIYGNVGAPDRLDFTVIGPAVNRTARLESLTKTLGTPLLMSREFAGRVAVPVRSLGRHAMRGVPEPQEVFARAADAPA